jgi:site-specific recombinase XerD
MPRKKKSTKRPPETYTAEEIGAVLKVLSRRAPTGIRNRAMIALGYRAGLRISEVLGLYPKDIDLKKGEIRILHGKGDKARTVGLDEETSAYLDLWLKKRQELGIKGRRRLFCTLNGDPIEDAYIRSMMPRIAKKAGLEKRFHFHGLRHSFAKELVEEGFLMPYIQRILGHSSLATTQKYLQSIAPQDIIDAMRERTWQT